MGPRPGGRHGIGANLFGLDRSGVLVGPPLAGAGVGLLRSVAFLVFGETGGLPAVFATAALLLAGIPVPGRMGAGRGDGG